MGNYAEYKKTYFGETEVFDCDLVSLDQNKGELIVSFRPSVPLNFIGIEFPVGCVSYGYFWKDRNYNVYHWTNEKGETLLFYFNVSRDTRIQMDKVTWLDLIVDVLLKPRDTAKVLDEDEVPPNMHQTDLSIIRETKSELLNNLERITEELEIRTASFL